MMHVIGCTKKQFSEDPHPLDELWWHSAFCEGMIEVAKFSNEVIERGFYYLAADGSLRKGKYYSDGPSYGEAIVALIWRKTDERSGKNLG